MAANGPYNAVTALRDSNHRHWRHFLADDTTVTAGWMAVLGDLFWGTPVMQGWLGWSQCRFWGSLHWSYSTNPGSGLWILPDHSDWKAMGFESLTYFLSPVILRTCAMFFVFFNLLIFFDIRLGTHIAAEQVLSTTSIGGEFCAHFCGRSVEIPCLKQKKIYNLEQLRQTRTHTHTHALYGGWIIRFKPLKFHILWDTWGYVWTWATSVTGWQVFDLAGCTNSAKWRWRYWIAWKILKDLTVSMGLRAEKKSWQKGCKDSDGCQEIQEGQKEPPPQVWSNKSIIDQTDLYIDSWSQEGCSELRCVKFRRGYSFDIIRPFTNLYMF